MSAPVLVGLAGLRLRAEERRALERLRPVGVLLLARNVRDRSQLRELIAEVDGVLRSSGVGSPVLAADQEGGVVAPLAAVVGETPSPRTLGTLDEVERTRAIHLEVARRMAAVGVRIALGPVADVDRPGNPVIATRSFGRDARRVERHVRAAVRGLHTGGVLACVKHWPGHGAVDEDSHLALPRLRADAAELERVDAPAFRAGVETGAGAVMVAHLLRREAAADAPPVSRDPSEISRLRRELGERVCVVADALEMGGYGVAAAEAALDAGCDLLLSARPVDRAMDALAGLRGRGVGERLAGWLRSPERASDLADADEDLLTEAISTLCRRAPRGPWPDRWRILDRASADRLLLPPPADFDLDPPGGEEQTTGRRAELAVLLGAAEVRAWTDEEVVARGPGLLVLAVRPLGPEVAARLGAWIDAGRPARILWFGADPPAAIAGRAGLFHLPEVRPEAVSVALQTLRGGATGPS